MRSSSLPRRRAARPPRITVVVFDLGRVLIDYEWRRALDGVRRWTPLNRRQIERRILAGNLLPPFERGRLTAREFHRRVEAALEAKIPYAEFRAAWCAIFTREITAVADAARRIQRAGRVRVAVLSNTNVLHARFLRRTWPLLSEIRHVYLSNEIGQRKPDLGAYRYVLRALRVPAPAVLFVDDLAGNVRVARRLGMRGVVARSPQVVLAALARLDSKEKGRRKKPRRGEDGLGLRGRGATTRAEVDGSGRPSRGLEV